MANVVVAGGSGFIGSAAVRRLVARGDRVSVMTAHPGRSSDRIRKAGAEPVEGDIQKPGTLRKPLEGADVVVQSLTFPSFPVEKKGRGWTFEEFEARGTKSLVEAARAGGVKRFVYVSGVGVAPDAAKVWHRAKWEGEQAILASGVPSTIVRPSWVYGEKDNSLNRFVSFARTSPFVPMLGSGTQTINPVWVEDVAKVLEAAAQVSAPDGIYEIGGPETLTMREVLATMLRVMQRRRLVIPVPPVLPKLAGLFLQYLPNAPLSPDAIDFATGTAIADTTALLRAFPMTLTPLAEGLATYLAPKP